MTRWRAGLVLAAAIGLGQCDRDPRPPTAAPDTASPPIAQARLGRAELLAALAQAASAYAAAAPVPEGAMITGRTFEMRLPFGCLGPRDPASSTPGAAHWFRADDGRTLTLRLSPADWTRSPLVGASGAATPAWDRVEGFWLTRPWLFDEACPRSPAPTTLSLTPPKGEGDPSEKSETLQPLTPPPSPMTAGLAVIQGADASRLGRRAGEAYAHVVRGLGDAPAVAPRDGYRLVLAGRVSAFADGRAIRCRSESRDRRPTCVAAVDLDLVAFEDASGARLSEWRPS